MLCKFCGHDDTTTEIVQLLDESTLNPLVHIINNIIDTGTIPDNFKLSIISPVYKQGNTNNIENYRHISLLTTFSKMFERIIKIRLSNCLEENNLHPNTLFVFIKGFNTEDTIISLTNDILQIRFFKVRSYQSGSGIGISFAVFTTWPIKLKQNIWLTSDI